MTRLAQLLSLKPGESWMASLVIGIMLVTALGAALGETGIEALIFLLHQRWSASGLRIGF
jgi:hypothetical protein